MLKNKTIVITGASRGIGRAIALRCAKDGANVAVAAKTSDPHPVLEGTIHSVVDEINNLGGKGFAYQLDVRDQESIRRMANAVVEEFGGVDVVVNNASAINITDTLNTPLKKFDLMHDVNVRGTFACSQAFIPLLKNAANPHILTLSPPINMDPKWFAMSLAYTMSKYGMSMCTLGMAQEFKKDGIAVNSLWPKTAIATAAIKYNFPEEVYKRSRTPEIVSDAAYEIITSDAQHCSGNFFVDEDYLRSKGTTDFSKYAIAPSKEPWIDFYLEGFDFTKLGM